MSARSVYSTALIPGVLLAPSKCWCMPPNKRAPKTSQPVRNRVGEHGHAMELASHLKPAYGNIFLICEPKTDHVEHGVLDWMVDRCELQSPRARTLFVSSLIDAPISFIETTRGVIHGLRVACKQSSRLVTSFLPRPRTVREGFNPFGQAKPSRV